MKKNILLLTALFAVSTITADVFYQGPRRIAVTGDRPVMTRGPVAKMVGDKMRLKVALTAKLNQAALLIDQIDAFKKNAKMQKDPKMTELWNKFKGEFKAAKATFDQLKEARIEKVKAVAGKVRGAIQERLDEAEPTEEVEVEEVAEVTA